MEVTLEVHKTSAVAVTVLAVAAVAQVEMVKMAVTVLAEEVEVHIGMMHMYHLAYTLLELEVMDLVTTSIIKTTELIMDLREATEGVAVITIIMAAVAQVEQ